MKKTRLALALTAVMLAVTVMPAFAATDEETTNLTVEVTESTQVNIAPDSLSYTSSSQAINPGSRNNTSDSGYKGIEIENSGSENITQIWFNTSTPGDRPYNSDDRPFGTGIPGNYDAGNFLQIKPQQELSGPVSGQGEGYQYVSRLEFNESNELSYIKEEFGSDGHRYGRFRDANESFFWVIDDTATTQSGANTCDGSGSSNLALGDNPQSELKTGTVDFEDGSAYTSYQIQQISGSNYGIVNTTTVQTHEQNKDYTFYTWCGNGDNADNNDGTFIIAKMWDIYAPEDDGSQMDPNNKALDYVLNAGTGGSNTDGDELKPGEHFTVNTRMSVPYAVAEGTVGQGDLTVIVNSDA